METVIWSKPENERAGTPLLVMMHGYGTDESRMVKLFDHLPPEFTCAALRGPRTSATTTAGSCWITSSPTTLPTSSRLQNAVFAWIDSVKARHSSVSLFGYSQGMAMASTLLRLRPEQFRAAVGLSGFVLDNDLLALSESFTTRPPFFWGRDRDDLVINDAATEHTEEWLHQNTQLTARTYPGMGHAISKAEIVDVSAFLRHYVLR